MCISRVLNQASVRAMQEMKEQSSKCDSSFKSLKDSGSSAKQARLLSRALKSGKSGDEKLKQAEESLRTVMYLSCWGPN